MIWSKIQNAYLGLFSNKIENWIFINLFKQRGSVVVYHFESGTSSQNVRSPAFAKLAFPN